MNYNQAIETINRLKDKQFKYSNVDEVYADLENLGRFIKDIKNELCVNCGKYKNEHLGACKGCKYE